MSSVIKLRKTSFDPLLLDLKVYWLYLLISRLGIYLEIRFRRRFSRTQGRPWTVLMLVDCNFVDPRSEDYSTFAVIRGGSGSVICLKVQCGDLGHWAFWRHLPAPCSSHQTPTTSNLQWRINIQIVCRQMNTDDSAVSIFKQLKIFDRKCILLICK